MNAGRDWKLNRDDGPTLSDEFIRAVMRPKVGVEAVAQARYGAQALEADRQATYDGLLYSDLMRREQELKAQLARVRARLDDLDALRVLETAT